MKKCNFILNPALIIALYLIFNQASAQVTIQPATASGSICLNHWTDLSTIEIAETNTNDFSFGSNQTLILTLPDGYEFDPGAGTVTYISAGDLTAIALYVIPSKVTISYVIAGTTTYDIIGISGLSITRTTVTAATNNLTRDAANPGTAVINGAPAGTVFGTFAQGSQSLYVTSSAFQMNSGLKTDINSPGNLMLRLSIMFAPSVNGCNDVFYVTTFNLSTNGSTNGAGDISAAHLYYTGINSSFSPANLYGSCLSPGSGAFQINGSQLLEPGTNFFWLCYDVPSSATFNNTLDGEFNSCIINGVTKVPSTQAPTGNRVIGIQEITSVKSGNWSDGTVWSGGVPPNSANDARILSGDSVTLVTNASVIDLTVEAGGKLNLRNSQLAQSGNMNCSGTVYSSDKSRLYISDYGSVKPAYVIPAGVTKLQKLTVNRASGATCNHDIRIGDVCPVISAQMDTGFISGSFPPLYLMNGVLSMTSGSKLRMENTDSLPYNIGCTDLAYVDGIISRYIRNDSRWHQFPLGNGAICRKTAVSRSSGGGGIMEAAFINQQPPNINYYDNNYFPGGVIDKFYWKLTDISGGPPKRMFFYQDIDFPGMTGKIKSACFSVAMNEVLSPTDEWHSPTSFATTTDDINKFVMQINYNTSGHPYWTFASSCFNTINQQIPAPTPGSNSPVCEGTQLNLTAADIPFASFSWSGPDGFSSSAQNPVVSNNATMAMGGNYSVFATAYGIASPVNSTTVVINPAPLLNNVTGGGSYCSESASPAVGLSGSETGINYGLYYEGDTLLYPVGGTGSPINFGNQIQEGNYTVEALNPATGCTETMSGSANVSIYNCPSSKKSVAINRTGAPADSSAMLDVSDTVTGVLFPRLTELQRDALIGPDEGLIIFNLTAGKINYFHAGNWYEVSSSYISANPPGGAWDYGVAINSTGARATPSAMLDVSSTAKGVLIPRTLPGAVHNAARGSIIFNIHSGEINYFNGTNWIALTGSAVSPVSGSGSQVPDGCAINFTNAPAAPSAVLDVAARNKALLIPRLTDLQRALTNPFDGLIIYNTTTDELQYNYSGWYRME